MFAWGEFFKGFLVNVITKVKYRGSRGSIDIKDICSSLVVPCSHLILSAMGERRKE